MLTPAFILLTIMLVLPIATGDPSVIIFTAVAVVLGAVLYPLLQHARQQGWVEFVHTTPNHFKASDSWRFER